MQHYNVYLYVILLIVILEFVWSQYLSARNRKMMTPVIPQKLVGIYNESDYRKQQEYQKINSRLGLFSGLFSFVIILITLLLGGFGWLDNLMRTFISNETWLGLAFFGVIMVISELMSLPFDYYITFVVEERFGFNKSTPKLFWLDQLKGLAVSVIVGGVILYLVIWLYNSVGSLAWLYAWGIVAGFSLFMLLFYSNLIVPLFNKQTPLEDGELRQAIEKFGSEVGFGINNIYVMDASKRSTKANAYFTGLGSKKRIVLFDTLINDLSTNEIVAVLAHEIGHYKKKHTLQGVVLSILTTGVMLFVLSLFLKNPLLAEAMGAEQVSFHLGLIAFSILFTPISLILGLFSSIQSRKNEYEADAFAARYGLADALVGGLKKLSVNSLSNLNPDPLFVYFHYSHPTLLQRIEAIEK